jgi:hypothetical protein
LVTIAIVAERPDATSDAEQFRLAPSRSPVRRGFWRFGGFGRGGYAHSIPVTATLGRPSRGYPLGRGRQADHTRWPPT